MGKTSLAIRFIEKIFLEIATPTVGNEVKNKTILIDGMEVHLDIIDTCGSEKRT